MATKKTTTKKQAAPVKDRVDVSIITTFYNCEKFIEAALNSVNAQNLQGKYTYEYIIVDDKSTDNSLKKVQDFIKTKVKDPQNWKVITPEKNLGCGGARKFGIEHAKGDHFMFLDADDYYIKTDFVLRALDVIISNKVDIVEFGIVFNQQDGRQVNNVVQQPLLLTPDQALIAMFKDNIIKFNVWSKIYTRKIVESYPYSDSRIFEDVRTTPIWVSNAEKILVMNSVEINYRASSGSIIRDDMVTTRVGTITAISELFPRFKNNRQLLKAMYSRSMVDLEALLHNHSSNDAGFNEMSRLNTLMLSYIYPDKYKEMTYHIEDDEEYQAELKRQKGIQTVEVVSEFDNISIENVNASNETEVIQLVQGRNLIETRNPNALKVHDNDAYVIQYSEEDKKYMIVASA